MFGDHDDSYEQEALNKVDQNDGDMTHDLLAGAAAAVAMREWQQKQEADGKPQQYDDAKTIIAGLATAAATHLIETKGMDQFDAFKAKRDAAEQAKKALAQSGMYGQQDYQKPSYGDSDTGDYSKQNEEDRTYGSGGAGEYGRGGTGGLGSGGRSGGYDNEQRSKQMGNDFGTRDADNDDRSGGFSNEDRQNGNYGNRTNDGLVTEKRRDGYGGQDSNEY